MASAIHSKHGILESIVTAVTLAGEPSINSVNIYPDLARWEAIDPEGEYAEVYNRYAHIRTEMRDAVETSFELLQADTFTVDLDIGDLGDLGVKYVLTARDYSDLRSASVPLEQVAENGEYRVYRVLS